MAIASFKKKRSCEKSAQYISCLKDNNIAKEIIKYASAVGGLTATKPVVIDSQ